MIGVKIKICCGVFLQGLEVDTKTRLYSTACNLKLEILYLGQESDIFHALWLE